jgi:uncharacterized OB-fold protein
MSTVAPLSAPLELSFDYTRSLGPVLGRFMAELARGHVVGVRGADGRVHVPPVEYDPQTHAPLGEFVPVSDHGVVQTWTWVPEPMEGQPLTDPFAWALVRLDGADTSVLHAVAVESPAAIRTGMRVQARWAADRVGSLTDIVCFEPETAPAVPVGLADAAAPLEILTTPLNLHYQHAASPQESAYLLALQEGRFLAQRCPRCGKVYVPPRGACPTDGVPTEEEVDLPDHGIVTTFCIVNVPFLGQSITPPYVAAYILLDGADIPFLHLVLGCEASEVRMGMRVRAVWRPQEEWGPTLRNVAHFQPTGEPDAPYESFAEHL